MCEFQNKQRVWHELMESALKALEAGYWESAKKQLSSAYELGVRLYGADDGAVGLVLLRLAFVSAEDGNMELAREYSKEAERIFQIYSQDASV